MIKNQREEKMVKYFLFGLLCLVCVLPAAAFAAEEEKLIFVIPPGKWWTVPEIAGKMNLSEGEKKKLDELFF